MPSVREVSAREGGVSVGLLDKLKGTEATLCGGDGEPEEEFGLIRRLYLRVWLARHRVIWFIEKTKEGLKKWRYGKQVK